MSNERKREQKTAVENKSVEFSTFVVDTKYNI